MASDLEPHDYFDSQIATCVGLGMNMTQAGAHLGCGPQTVSNRIKARPEFYERAVADVQAALAVVKAEAITDVTGAIEKRADAREAKIKAVFDRAIRLTERAIDLAENDPNLSMTKLLEMHTTITVWASKFSATEAPKRLQMEGGATIRHEHYIPREVFDALDVVMREQRLIAADAIEAEVVEQEPASPTN